MKKFSEFVLNEAAAISLRSIGKDLFDAYRELDLSRVNGTAPTPAQIQKLKDIMEALKKLGVDIKGELKDIEDHLIGAA